MALTPYVYNQLKAKPVKNLDGVMVQPPRTLSYQFIVTNKLPLWVLTAIPPHSSYTLTIKKPNGPGEAVRIRRELFPQCITDDFNVAWEDLARGGQQFHVAFEKGMLILVWPSDGEALSNSSGAKANRRRQEVSKYSTLNANMPTEFANRERNIQAFQDMEKVDESDPDEDAGPPVNARLMDLVSRVLASEVKVGKAADEFEDMLEILTERDYTYAIANLPPGKLREWVQGLFAQDSARLHAEAEAEAAERKSKKLAEAKAAAAAARKAKAEEGDDKFNVFDDAPEMTEEEAALEAAAAAEGRLRQRL